MKRIIFSLALLLTVACATKPSSESFDARNPAAAKGTGQVDSSTNDSNVSKEGNSLLVKRSACLNQGGAVTDDDRRYFICAGGKYDGYITAGPATDCVAKAIKLEEFQRAVVENVTGEKEYLEFSSRTLDACREHGKSFGSVTEMLSLAKKNCQLTANQGMSQLYLGSCYLKAVDLAIKIMGQN